MMTRQVTVMYICILLHYLGIAYIARQIDTTSIWPFTARVHPVLGYIFSLMYYYMKLIKSILQLLPHFRILWHFNIYNISHTTTVS